ncbi:hypothetical protein LX32DRAFT_650583 [Colletotrichum zoysiae]|uniref:Uncharacterized protein n=1 Tax=Colletotrichum zoysiae TaxID=1216348 RepID=A0AAD9HMA1_9PEZI|nr:hypothetical protein LX32DRAFT_650583 [Colletotrichum zoysiae]
MEECSSVDYLGSLVTLCNTDKYQSICINDRKGHVSCNVTLGGPFSIAGDLQHFFLPYGTVAWLSSVIAIWIWVCLVNDTAPLNPNRAIKHKAFVYIYGMICVFFLVMTAIFKVPQLKNRDLKIIAIGHVVAVVLIQSTVLSHMRKNTVDHKEPEKQEDMDKYTSNDISTKKTDKDNITPRPSVELARSTSSASTAVSASEKPGFLDKISSKNPGTQRGEKPSTLIEASTEAQRKEKTAVEGSWSLLLGTICLAPGHIAMFYGVVGVARQIFATRPSADTRQQREVRDAFVLFATITGIGIIIVSFVIAAAKGSAAAAQSPHDEDVTREAAENKSATGAETVREAVVSGAVVLSGFLSLWCQYFVLAAAARDTHGIVHLGQTSNLTLVYLILSKLLLFAC